MLPAHLIEKYPDACRMAPNYQPLYTNDQTQEQRNVALEKGLALLPREFEAGKYQITENGKLK